MNTYNEKHKHTASKKRHFGRIISLVLVTVMILTLALPIVAAALEPNTQKEEVVYINLNSDGSVNKIYVVNIFELNEDGQIIDYGDYTALRNMTSGDKIKLENETVRIDTKAGKLYYEGILSNRSIPWNFDIRYYLDGTEYKAAECAGKDGAFKITMSVTQNADCDSVFFVNYALQISFTLDTALCKNITATGATAANVGGDRQLTYTVLPGNEKYIEITADVTDFEMDGIAVNGIPMSMDVNIDMDDNACFNDKIEELQDGVTKLDDGAIDLNNGASDLKDGATELKDGTDDLMDGTDKLKDGAAELKEGAGDLKDGATEIKDGAADAVTGANDLVDGASELKDGADKLNQAILEAVDGALKIYNGAAELKDGTLLLQEKMSELYGGLSALSAKSDDLRNGAYAVFGQLCSSAETQLNAALTAGGMQTVMLTPENYQTVLLGILSALDADDVYTQAYNAALTEVTSQVEAQADVLYAGYIESTADSVYSQYIHTNADSIYLQYMNSLSDVENVHIYQQAAAAMVMQQLMAGGMNETQAQDYLSTSEGQMLVATAVGNMTAEDKQNVLTVASQSLDDTQKEQILAGALAALTPEQKAQIRAGAVAALTNEQKTQIKDAYIAQTMASGEVTGRINTAVSATGDSATQISALKGQLDSYKGFYDGLVQYTSGVDSAASGSRALLDGVSELVDGASELYDGSKELYDGLCEIQSGSAELLSGTIELRDGTLKMKNGVVKLSDGSIELLNGVIELSDGVAVLYDGVIELRDGVITLADGAVELYDGTVELYDGTVELKDGTIEFKDKTATLKTDLKDKIKEAIDGMLGGDFTVKSFVSEKNTNIESVQFVIKTPAIEKAEATVAEPELEAQLNFLQKLLALFGIN